MLELTEWMRATRWPPKPWLMLGKGPSFSRRGDFDLSAFNLIGLNHVVREQDVDVAHSIDIDVVRDCGSLVADRARWLLMPRRPHVDFGPGPRLLEDYLDEIPVLSRMEREGRLVWYSSSMAPVQGSPTVGVRYFSSESVLNILALMGVKHVRSLGIDGGVGYSSTFADLSQRTRLANKQPTFDLQFAEMEKIVKRNEMDYKALVEPMRVFVGVDDSQLVAAKVLEHSIRKHAGGPVEFTAMKDLPIPMPKDHANRPKTGFSFYRFAIPQLCGYQGRALYLDADMQVFADISELWKIPFDGASVMCTYQAERPAAWKDNPWFHPGRQMSVMLLDCGRLSWDPTEIVRGLDEGRYTYPELMFELAIVPESEVSDGIPVEWNSLEAYELGVTKLTHYTVVPTQPWKTDFNPLRHVWEAEFAEAVAAGAVGAEVVLRSIRDGHVKASLAAYLPGGASPTERLRQVVGRAKRLARRVKSKIAR